MGEKNQEEFLLWLQEEGFSQAIVDAFREQEVDGECFILLKDEDITSMVQPFGPRRKLIMKRDILRKIWKNSGGSYDDIELEDASGTGNYSHDQDTEDVCCASSSVTSLESAATETNHERQSIMTEHLPKRNDVKEENPGTVFMHIKRKVKKETEQPLPMPFELPFNYPIIVQEGIDKKQLTGMALSKFVACIASAMFKYKGHPRKDEYESISKQIVQKFPFLKCTKGREHGYLTEALKEKMKYLRNAKPRITKRPTQSPSASDMEEKKTKKEYVQYPSTQVQHFPSIAIGEDDHSYADHMTMLEVEHAKIVPDARNVAELMAKTFMKRRKEIEEQPQKVADLLRKYPFLKRLDIILDEMERIVDKSTQGLVRKWKDAVPKIYQLAGDSACSHHSDIKHLLEIHTNTDAAKSVIALMMLIYLLPDTRSITDTKKLVTFVPEYVNVANAAKDVELPQPVILIRGTLENIRDAHLICEKMMLCTLHKVEDLAVVLLAAYYTFNMHYCSGCSNVFSALEVLLMDVVPPKRTRLMSFINAFEHTQ